MMIWNDTINGQKGLVRDEDIIKICRQVLHAHCFDIVPEIWIAHVLNLWEERQLGRGDMLCLMQEYHEFYAAQNILNEIMQKHKSE